MKLKPRGRNDSHKFEYSKITDRIFVGSDFCTGSNCKEHKEEFDKLGINSEINLSIEKREVPPENLESYSWIPVVDGHAPTMWQMELGSSIIDKAVRSGRNIYVHCRNGHGRSPTLVAAYLIRYQKMSVDKAIKTIEEKRPEAHIEKVQKKALREFSKK